MDYVGILDGKGKTWGVRIPDLPGCHGGGETPDEAVTDATTAAREWAAHQQARGVPISAPRSMDAIRRDPEAAFEPATETMVLIPSVTNPHR